MKAQYANDCCDNGWRHLCGGPHGTMLVEQTVTNTDTGEAETALVEVPADGNVPERPEDEGGCQTIRCTVHCSCFAPDGEHLEGCALATVGG